MRLRIINPVHSTMEMLELMASELQAANLEHLSARHLMGSHERHESSMATRGTLRCHCPSLVLGGY